MFDQDQERMDSEGMPNPHQEKSQERLEQQAEESNGHLVNPKNKAYEVVLNGENLGGEGENGNVFKQGRVYKQVTKEALDQKDAFGNKYLL